MMKASAGAIAAVFALAATLSAHHTVSAIYDPAHRATLTGVVSDVEWKLPHVLVHLDIASPDGSIVRWEIEAQAPNNLQRRGLAQDAIKPGATLSSTVCLARDGSHKGYAQEFVLPTGTFYNGGCAVEQPTVRGF
jgi:Family of unknown function (DUF6152)